MSEEHNKILERLTILETEINDLKNNHNSSTENKSKKEKKSKEDKKPRAKTAYNVFVSEYINEQKIKLGDDFRHKIAFSEAAKKWTAQKGKKKKDRV